MWVLRLKLEEVEFLREKRDEMNIIHEIPPKFLILKEKSGKKIDLIHEEWDNLWREKTCFILRFFFFVFVVVEVAFSLN
jgi:hypothetical protein